MKSTNKLHVPVRMWRPNPEYSATHRKEKGGDSTYKVIAVVVPLLAPDTHLFVIVTGIASGAAEIFRQELSLFQELVRGTLHTHSQCQVTHACANTTEEHGHSRRVRSTEPCIAR